MSPIKRFALGGLAAAALCSLYAFMPHPIVLPTSSAKGSGTAADNGGGVDAWTNITNAQGTADATYATCAMVIGDTSNFAKLTNYGFTSSDVPAGATINGIRVNITNHANNASGVTPTTVEIVKGGTVQTTQNKGTSVALPTTDTTTTYGATNDLWGVTWAQTDITSSGFGMTVQYTSAGTRTVSLDCATIDVTYTVATPHNGMLLGVGFILWTNEQHHTGWHHPKQLAAA